MATSRTLSPEEYATRVALIGMRFPRLAVKAAADAARIAAMGFAGKGPAAGVIHVAASTATLWHGGSDSAAELLDGTWEQYVRLACKRIKALNGYDATEETR